MIRASPSVPVFYVHHTRIRLKMQSPTGRKMHALRRIKTEDAAHICPAAQRKSERSNPS